MYMHMYSSRRTRRLYGYYGQYQQSVRKWDLKSRALNRARLFVINTFIEGIEMKWSFVPNPNVIIAYGSKVNTEHSLPTRPWTKNSFNAHFANLVDDDWLKIQEYW